MTVENQYWSRLMGSLDRRVDQFEGVGAVAVLDLVSGRTAGVNQHLHLPIASTVKIHLLTVLGELAGEGLVDLDARASIDQRVPGSGVLAYLDDLDELTWRDVANLMIIVSDNTATNLIIDLLGYERIAGFLERWDLHETRVQRKMQDHAAVAEGRENLASADDLLKMLALLHDGSVFRPGVASWCLEVLSKPKKSPFASTLPSSIRLSNKGGAMDRVRCDAGIVHLSRRPFAMAVLTAFGPGDSDVAARWVADTGRAGLRRNGRTRRDQHPRTRGATWASTRRCRLSRRGLSLMTGPSTSEWWYGTCHCEASRAAVWSGP
jgi:beta-lactamase class A